MEMKNQKLPTSFGRWWLESLAESDNFLSAHLHMICYANEHKIFLLLKSQVT